MSETYQGSEVLSGLDPREEGISERWNTFNTTFPLETQQASQGKQNSRDKRTQIETDDTNRKEHSKKVDLNLNIS